jgi:predicted MFS family arabinose efflux permease
MIHALLSSLAYCAIAATGYFHSHLSPEVYTAIRYFWIYPAISGFFSCITIIITWSMDNRVAKEGKGAGVAVLNIIGQCGPLIGTRLYPASDGPWYVPGMVACSLFMAFVFIMASVLRLLLQRENRKMAEKENSMEMGSHREEREGLMGSISAGAGLQAANTSFTYII